ncbi:MAG TPA: hypothetical protein ENK62_03165 [Chromatiales bacterium]|nr:hypothetical protein [Chromatiales bacterium]
MTRCTALVFSALVPVAAAAGPTPDLETLYQMLQTQQAELARQRHEIERLRKALAHRRAGPAAAAPSEGASGAGGQPEAEGRSQERASAAVRMDRKGLRVESGDGRFAMRLGGRLHLDGAVYASDKRALGDGLRVRRARLTLRGHVYDVWGYRLDAEFASGTPELRNAWVAYRGLKRFDLSFGQQQEPVGLEELTSSNAITFMERALPIALVPSYHVGALVRTHGDGWTAAAGAFGEPVGRTGSDRVDDGWGVSGRITWAPWATQDGLLHVGVSAAFREPAADATVRVRATPETKVADVSLVNTGSIAGVRHFYTLGSELAGTWGPFSVQGEYLRSTYLREGPDVDFDGWYVFASWVLTGEHRNYSAARGVFTGVRPRHKLGAWELAVRYSTLDLTDADVRGGRERNWTFGLNWYPNRNTRLMANFILVDTHPSRDGVSDDPYLFQARAQVNF